MMRFIILCVALINISGVLTSKLHKKKNRIIGGNDIPIEQYPYMVGLRYDGEFYCGGTIIALNRILTSASCVTGVNKSSLSVRAGSSKYNSGGEQVKVNKVQIHPKFNNPDYDVAVLVLEQNLRESSSVKVASLQPSGKEVTTDTDAIISGWGQSTANFLIPYRLSEELKGATVVIVDQKKCAEAYEDQNIAVTDRMICAAAEGKGTCRGDHGGPMVDLDAVVIGIVSWAACGSRDYPGVFTKISNSEIHKFIEEAIKN